MGGYPENIRKYVFALSVVAVAAGLVLSGLNLAGVCSDQCAKTASYKLFGLSFSLVGVVFFSVLMIALWVSRKSGLAALPYKTMLFAGLGAELYFLAVQKYSIGRFCPMCLGVASSVLCAAAAYIAASTSDCVSALRAREGKKERRKEIMRAAWKSMVVLWMVGIGFGVALLSVSAPKDTLAESAGVTLVQGNESSNVDVYVITDWFCPACQKVEPEIEKSFPEITPSTRVIFIDLALHPETYNYMPYNVSFAVNEKKKYMELRKALSGLAKKNVKSPTVKDVQEAIAHLGVKYKELPQMDIMAAMRYFDGAVKILGVDSTPVVIVLNRKTKNFKKLSGTGGSDGISYENVIHAVKTVSAG